jgi:hypothetical protein
VYFAALSGNPKRSVRLGYQAALAAFTTPAIRHTDNDGVEPTIEDIAELPLQLQASGVSEPQRLYRAVCDRVRPGPLEDDFSLVAVHCD